jgi:uncharacterized protein (DUF885 family)
MIGKIVIQEERQGLPRFRRLIPFAAFTEGWVGGYTQSGWQAK